MPHKDIRVKKIYQREFARENARRIRNAVFEILGDTCVRCGFGDKRALQVDHIQGGGYQDTKAQGGNQQMYRNILKDPDGARSKYQILCANCNWIKRAEFGESKPRVGDM